MDPARELEEQMRAADALIESLESEVTELRRDLDHASVALRKAQEEISARGDSLGETERLQRDLEAARAEAYSLRGELTDLRQEYADEQLRLSNEHISGMAALREELEEQRRADVEAASSGGKVGALREELRKERTALEERHKTEVENLKLAAERWEEKLRSGYRDLEERHRTEVEGLETERTQEIRALQKSYAEEMDALTREHRDETDALKKAHSSELEKLRRGTESEKIELERSIREELGRGLDGERSAERDRHKAELQALRSAAAGRELDIQKQLRAEIEGRRVEVEELRIELESMAVTAEERRRREVREVKGMAEGRERELRRAHAQRLAEEKETGEKRAEALRAQREADIRSLKERQAKELSEARRRLQEILDGQEEKQKSERAGREEHAEGLEARQESEARVYGERLAELERERAEERKASEEALQRREHEHEGERARLEERLAELREALEEQGTVTAELREALEAARAGGGRPEPAEAERQPADDGLSTRLKEVDSARLLAEERATELERRLAEAVEEGRRREHELGEARHALQQASSPEQRLRAGISIFNNSEHTRTVASISKALGLPKVHVGTDDGAAGKPVVTFVWSEMAWRRYVSDPTEGVEEPRVYLIGTGDDPSEIHDPNRSPNARMDAQGRLILGVQAR